MGFHRLTVPSYTGGLPSGYDYINNVLEGTPAPAASVVVAEGPSAGSWFFGFNDDLTSLNLNRGPRAVAENCDYIDDLMRRDLAVPTKNTSNSVSLPVGTYLGPSGTPASAVGYRQLFTVIDEATREEARVNNQPCVVTAVLLPGSDAIGSGQFSTGTCILTITPTPPGAYHVVYYARSNQATHSRDAWFYTDQRSTAGQYSFLDTTYIAAPAKYQSTAGTVSSVTVPAGAYIDTAGMPWSITDLFIITDLNDRPFLTTAGAVVTVTAVTPSGAVVDGFSTGTTALTLSAAVNLVGGFRVRFGAKRPLHFAPTGGHITYALNEAVRIGRNKTDRAGTENVTGAWKHSGTTQFTGAVTMGAVATFTAPPVFSALATFNGNVKVNPGTFISDAFASFTGGISLSGDTDSQLSNHDLNLINGSELNIDSSSTLKLATSGSPLQFTSTVTVTKNVEFMVGPSDEFHSFVKSARSIAGNAGYPDIWYAPFQVPHGAVIKSISATIDPAGAVADTRFALSLRVLDTSGDFTYPVYWEEDPNTGASYFFKHEFEISGLNVVVDASSAYALEAVGEHGTNAMTVVLYMLHITYEITTINPAYR